MQIAWEKVHEQAIPHWAYPHRHPEAPNPHIAAVVGEAQQLQGHLMPSSSLTGLSATRSPLAPQMRTCTTPTPSAAARVSSPAAIHNRTPWPCVAWPISCDVHPPNFAVLTKTCCGARRHREGGQAAGAAFEQRNKCPALTQQIYGSHPWTSSADNLLLRTQTSACTRAFMDEQMGSFFYYFFF